MMDNCTAPYGIMLLRITLGLLFVTHVYLKLFIFGIDGFVQFFGSLGLPAILAYATILIEIVGAISLILGIYARWFSFILIFVILGTIVFVHGAKGFFFSNSGGGWEYPAFWAIALFVQCLLGDGKGALVVTPKHCCFSTKK